MGFLFGKVLYRFRFSLVLLELRENFLTILLSFNLCAIHSGMLAHQSKYAGCAEVRFGGIEYQNFIFVVLQIFIVKRHITWQMCVSVCLNAVSSVENWEVIGSCNVICCVFWSLLLASIYCITLSSSFGCIPSLFFSSWDVMNTKIKDKSLSATQTHTHTRHHIDNGIGSHARTTFHRFLCLYMCQTLAHRLH